MINGVINGAELFGRLTVVRRQQKSCFPFFRPRNRPAGNGESLPGDYSSDTNAQIRFNGSSVCNSSGNFS